MTVFRRALVAEHLFREHGIPTATVSSRSISETTKIREPKNNKNTMDASQEYAHNYRESGKYGSHPSHDNYGEDADP
jgi:hypothetical protein